MDSFNPVIVSPVLTPLLLACAAIAVLALYWWRAGSWHIIPDAMWKLMTGRSDADDPIVRALLREGLDLERFRLVYRLKVQSLDEVHRLAGWTAQRQMSVGQLTRLRRWVDPASPDVVLEPPSGHVTWQSIGILLAGCACLLALPAFTSEQALLRMKESDVWFKSNGVEISSPFNQWHFDGSHCASQRPTMAKASQFTAAEVDAVCAALDEQSLSSLVARTVSLQRWAGGITVLISLAWAVGLIRIVSEAHEAMRLREKLKLA